MRSAHRLLLLVAVALAVPAQAETKKPIVTLHLSVSGARVLVDGQEQLREAGQVAELLVAPGTHALRVERDGFLPWEQQLAVTDVPLRVEVLLRVAPPTASAPPAQAPAPLRPLRVAVYDLKSAELDALVARTVSESILAEVRKLERVSAISSMEIGEMLSFEQQRQLLGCGDDACFEEIGGALGVDELVTGSIARLGESHLFTLRRLDLRTATGKGSFSRRFAAGNGEEFLSGIGPAIQELYPDHPLRAGRERGVSQAMVARLNPPPLSPKVFYGTAGAAAVAAAVGTFFGLSFRDAQSQHDALVARAQGEIVAASDVKSWGALADSRAGNANIAFVLAGVLAVAAGVETIWTNWEPGAPTDAPSSAVRLRVAPTGLVFAWE